MTTSDHKNNRSRRTTAAAIVKIPEQVNSGRQHVGGWNRLPIPGGSKCETKPTVVIPRKRTTNNVSLNLQPAVDFDSLEALPELFAKDTFDMRNAKEVLKSLNELDGYIGSALVDGDSGMMLAADSSTSFNFEIAAAGNTEVLRAKRKVAKALGLNDVIEDLLITLGKQYHLIRPVANKPSLFFYMVLDRSKANLAMARYKLSDVEKDLS